MNRRTEEYPRGMPRTVAETVCQGIEQDQAAVQREATLSPIAQQEIEKILRDTIGVMENTRVMQGGLCYTLEERQAIMQQLKRNVYGKRAAEKDKNQQVNERFLQFLTDEGLDPDTINMYATALELLQHWFGKPLPPNPYDVFPEYVQHLRETGQPENRIATTRSMLKQLMRFERQESEAPEDQGR
jgi:hypothetical protein